MPGTHDSATKYVRFKPICNTQNLTIEEQLQIGVRYLDMRFELKDGRKLVAVHSIADCKKERGLKAADLTAADTVNMCESFLKENPGETILFQLKEDDGDAGIALFGEFYAQCIRGREELWYLENRIPALGEVRGKIVLLRVVGVDASHFDDKTCGIDFSASRISAAGISAISPPRYKKAFGRQDIRADVCPGFIQARRNQKMESRYSFS